MITENAQHVQNQIEMKEQKARAIEAEEYRRKLEEFIDTICHEIRNPLNGIYGGVTQTQVNTFCSIY